MKLIRILVTDAGYKHTLSAVRSLGKAGYDVICGSESQGALSFYSKYCTERFIYPTPSRKKIFVSSLLEYLKSAEVDVVLPIGYLSTSALSEYQEQIRSFSSLPLASWDSMRIARNKDETVTFAEKNGVRTPTVYTDPKEITSFPVVAKSAQESGAVRYINSEKELAKFTKADYIIQDYIPGEGYGFFALLNHGKLRAFFMHKRIREYPITGGPSTSAMSVFDSQLRDLGLRLLKALKWHGVAMVEFKKDVRDGKFTLMEINPKFWGSLDLSIASGVDFPTLAVKMAIEGDIEPITRYTLGVRFQWPFPDDFLHFLANPRSVKSFVGDFFNTQINKNVDLKDIKPNLVQFYHCCRTTVRHIQKRNLRYPHGILRK